MSLSKSKCWYSKNCLYFLNRAVPLGGATGRGCVVFIAQVNLMQNKAIGSSPSCRTLVLSPQDLPICSL